MYDVLLCLSGSFSLSAFFSVMHFVFQIGFEVSGIYFFIFYL